MPTFQRAPQSVEDMAAAVLAKHESHAPLLNHAVKIDYIFAFADVDKDTGEKINNAISSRGFRVLGQAKKMPLKDRAMGRGDAEILLDADHWNEINDGEKFALLDHELHHLEVAIDERGVLRDDLERPKLKLRKHTVEIGWFAVVAARNGIHSIERIQAAELMEVHQAEFWPNAEQSAKGNGDVTISGAGQSVTMSAKRFGNIAKEMAGKK